MTALTQAIVSHDLEAIEASFVENPASHIFLKADGCRSNGPRSAQTWSL